MGRKGDVSEEKQHGNWDLVLEVCILWAGSGLSVWFLCPCEGGLDTFEGARSDVL